MKWAKKNHRVRRFLKIWFSDYQWCRKFLGGHWERWITTLPMAPVWINDGPCYIKKNGGPPPWENLRSYPPGCCRYHIECEDWGA